MRIFTMLFIGMLVVCGSAIAQEGNGADMAVVNVDRVLTVTKAAKNIDAQLSKKREQYQQEFSKKEQELKKVQEDLLSSRKDLDEAEFNKRRQDFEKKLAETQKLFSKRRESLTTAFGKANARLQKEMFETVAAVAEERGYRTILDRKSVVIVEEDLDITAEVVSRIDKSLPDIKLEIE